MIWVGLMWVCMGRGYFFIEFVPGVGVSRQGLSCGGFVRDGFVWGGFIFFIEFVPGVVFFRQGLSWGGLV